MVPEKVHGEEKGGFFYRAVFPRWVKGQLCIHIANGHHPIEPSRSLKKNLVLKKIGKNVFLALAPIVKEDPKRGREGHSEEKKNCKNKISAAIKRRPTKVRKPKGGADGTLRTKIKRWILFVQQAV